MWLEHWGDLESWPGVQPAQPENAASKLAEPPGDQKLPKRVLSVERFQVCQLNKLLSFRLAILCRRQLMRKASLEVNLSNLHGEIQGELDSV